MPISLSSLRITLRLKDVPDFTRPLRAHCSREKVQVLVGQYLIFHAEFKRRDGIRRVDRLVYVGCKHPSRSRYTCSSIRTGLFLNMPLLNIAPTDLIDIAVVGLLLWGLVIWTRRVHARMALIGLAFLGGFYLLARQFELLLTAWIFQGFFAVLVVLLVVVFQDDLRRLFEQIAALGLRRKASRPESGSLGVLVRGLRQLADKRRGALVVLPGREPVERHLQGGVSLDATISEELLDSLFDPGSAGHDGALVMRADKLERFAVHLPLSENRDELGPGGTRHAAALGLAERSDALCLVVSEERGTIGIAADGRLEVLEDSGELLDRIQGHLQRAGATSQPRLAWSWWGRRLAEAVVSFALASVAWMTLVPGAAQEEVTHYVPVVVSNMPKGFALVGVKPSAVAVTVAGPRRAMLLARSEDFRLVIDADLVSLGRRTFAVAADAVRHETDLQVIKVDPPKVRLAVTKE